MVGFRARVAFRGQLESRNSCEPGVTTLILARCPDPLHGWIRDDLLPRNPARIESMEEKKEGRRERKNRSSPIVEITAIIARVRCFLPVTEEEHHLNYEWFINFTPGSQRSAAALEQSQTRRAQLKFSNFNKVSPARIHRDSDRSSTSFCDWSLLIGVFRTRGSSRCLVSRFIIPLRFLHPD